MSANALAPGLTSLRPARVLAPTLVLLLAAACGESPQGVDRAGGPASVAVTASIEAAGGGPASQQQGSGGLASAFAAADVASVRVTGSGGAVLADREVGFDGSGGGGELSLELTIEDDRVPATVELALRRGGDRLFEGSTGLTLVAGETSTVELGLAPVAAAVAVPEGPLVFTALGDSARLKGAVTFATGDTIPGLVPTWSSADAAVADVSADGTVVADAPGATEAVATHAGLSASVAVEVDPEVATVALEPDAATFGGLGESEAFSVRVTDANGNPVEGEPVTWTSTDVQVAAVDGSGVAEARGDGSAQVVAEAMGTADTASVTVELGPTGQVAGQVGRVQPPSASSSVAASASASSGGSTVGAAIATDPAGGVEVRFLQGGEVVSRTTTASDGTWTSPAIPPGTYTLAYASPDLATVRHEGVEIAEGTTGSVAEVPMVPASDQPGTVEGRVTNVRTGNGVAGAAVEVRRGLDAPEAPVVASGTAGADGGYAIGGVAAGTYTITASAPDFASDVITGVALGGATFGGQDLALVPPPAVEIGAPSDGATFGADDVIPFRGSADDPEQGALTGDALVWTSDQAGEIGTGESFTTSLPAGSHTITLTATNDRGAGASTSVDITVERTDTGQLEGRVADGKSDAGVEGVEVRFLTAGSGGSSQAALQLAPGGGTSDVVVGTTTTGSDGGWSSPPLPAGTYEVEFAKDGRVTTTLFGATVVENATTPVASVPLAPEGGTGTVSGTVRNARTLAAVSGASVELRSGVNHTSGPTVDETTSGEGGFFEFQEELAGTYTIVARADGFVQSARTTVVVGAENSPGQDVNLSPTGSGQGELQVVLTWGETPTDLDAHMRGPLPESTSRFHVYWANMGSLTSSPFTALDVDDVTSFGPETITVGTLADGTYRYFVHDFSNSFVEPPETSFGLANSGARVGVFSGGQQIAEFFPPNEDGTEWTVFEFDVADGRIVDLRTVNTMAYEDFSSDVGTGSGTASVQADVQVAPDDSAGRKPYDEDHHRQR